MRYGQISLRDRYYFKKKRKTTKAREKAASYDSRFHIDFTRTCKCPPTHINCMTAKEWLKSQIGVWQFFYEKRDIRDKNLHPATFPISLAKKVIGLFTHQEELVIDPFIGSGTTLVAAQDLNRNAVGFDLQKNILTFARIAYQPIIFSMRLSS